MRKQELEILLENAYHTYAKEDFIELDPIQIPRRFSKKEDIEIAGFLAATIAWGQRPTIVKNAWRMMELMDFEPHDFITNHQASDLKRFDGFVHRTFNASDLQFFIHRLQSLYRKERGLEVAFSQGESALGAYIQFSSTFFQSRTSAKNSKTRQQSIKRIIRQKDQHVFEMDGSTQ